MYDREILEFIENELTDTPHIECEFNVGDTVIFTNIYGYEFKCKVIGFSANDSRRNGAFIHIALVEGNGSAYWFPHLPSELRLAD
jgi:hypothetical protein